MSHRQRNRILFFLQDDGVRDILVDAARREGWEPSPAKTMPEALDVFAEHGDAFALVVTDDMTGPFEGRRRGMVGIEFLEQRSVHMFAANTPFVLLMFTDCVGIREWADEGGGWTVAMPTMRVSVLTALFDRLERDHPLPPKPAPRSGER